MAGTLVRVRFIRPWQQYVVGNEITPNGVLRDWLVGNGYVEILKPAPAALESPMNREAAPSQTRARSVSRR